MRKITSLSELQEMNMSIELRSSYEYRKFLIAGGMKPEDVEKNRFFYG